LYLVSALENASFHEDDQIPYITQEAMTTLDEHFLTLVPYKEQRLAFLA
jgi:hypothetical protein